MRWLCNVGRIRAQLLTQRNCRFSPHRCRQHESQYKLITAWLSPAQVCGSYIAVAIPARSLSRLVVKNPGLWKRTLQLLGTFGRRRVYKVSGLVSVLAVSFVYQRLNLCGTDAKTAFCHEAVSPDFEGSELQVSVESLSPGNQISLFRKFHLALRFFYLSLLFCPVVFLYGLSSLFNSQYLSSLGWRYMLITIQIAGPAFVKLGQWAGTRRDLFSEEFCSILSRLHTRCEPHPWADTVKTLEENFGKDWRESLVIVDNEPIGSGCVAQVYKGHLKVEDGCRGVRRNTRSSTSSDTGSSSHVTLDSTLLVPPTASPTSNSGSSATLGTELSEVGGPRFIPIAVKVLHPGIVGLMERDICVMKYAAVWVDFVYPDVHWVALKECVNEFSKAMWNQLDLKEEAKNLLRFHRLLHYYSKVKFPTPIQPYITNSVLVESFEQGTEISNYLDKPGGKLQKNLARIGIEVLLDMLFIHNLVHGDLHPGNILVQDPMTLEEDPTLVLLDCGIATSLSPLDLEKFTAVFTAIVKGEGTKVADLFLGTQQCATKEEYRRSMADLVETGRLHLNMKETQVGALFSTLFNILIEHKVRIEPKYTCVMVAMMVIEGLGRALDPSLDILAAARPVLLERAKQTIRQKLRLCIWS